MKKVLLAGYYGHNNIGDEAIAEALTKELTRRGYEPVILSGDPVLTSQMYGVDSFNRGQLKNIIEAIKVVDFVIVGGGSLLQDTTSSHSLWYYLGLILLSRMFGKKVFLAYQGIGPINKKYNVSLTQLVLNAFDKIWVRDEMSISYLREIGVVKPEIALCSDAVFMLQAPSKERIRILLSKAGIKLDDERKLIGIAPRKWGSEDKSGTFARIADEIIEKFNARVVFFSLHKNVDITYINEICSRMTNRAYIISDQYLPSEIMGMMGEMDLNIGVRLHSLIFSAKMAKPMLGISYDPKVDGFLEMLDMSPVCSYSDLNKKDIIDSMDWIFKNTFPIDTLKNAVEKFEKMGINTMDEILLESEMV